MHRLLLAALLLVAVPAQAEVTASPAVITEISRGSTFRPNTLYQIATSETLVYLFIDANGVATLTSSPRLKQ